MGIRQRWRDHRVAQGRGAGVPAAAEYADKTIPNLVPEQVYHDAAQYRLSTQISSNDTLDAKVTQALTIGGAALPLTFALVSASKGASDVLRLASAPSQAFTIALACYGVVGFLYLVVGLLGPRGLSVRPDIANFKKQLPRFIDEPQGGRVLKGWVGDEYQRSIARNTRALAWKAAIVFFAQVALVVELATLAWGANLILS